MTPIEVCEKIVKEKSYQIVKFDKKNPINLILLGEDAKDIVSSYSEDDEIQKEPIRSTRLPKGAILIDLFTASVVHAIYVALNSKNKEKLNKLSLHPLINFCFSLYSGHK